MGMAQARKALYEQREKDVGDCNQFSTPKPDIYTAYTRKSPLKAQNNVGL